MLFARASIWPAMPGVRLSNNWKVIVPTIPWPLMLKLTLLFVCGMTLGVTLVGSEAVAPKLMV